MQPIATAGHYDSSGNFFIYGKNAVFSQSKSHPLGMAFHFVGVVG
jgi:hypothetical protein